MDGGGQKCWFPRDFFGFGAELLVFSGLFWFWLGFYNIPAFGCVLVFFVFSTRVFCLFVVFLVFPFGVRFFFVFSKLVWLWGRIFGLLETFLALGQTCWFSRDFFGFGLASIICQLWVAFLCFLVFSARIFCLFVVFLVVPFCVCFFLYSRNLFGFGAEFSVCSRLFWLWGRVVGFLGTFLVLVWLL